MSVYGGSIGPRIPKINGENCGNCGGVFVMQPGYAKRDGIVYASWKCAQCDASEETAVGRDGSYVAPAVMIKSSDFVE